MLMTGKNITRYNDTLQKVPVKVIYDKVRNPGREFAQLIDSLRALALLDPAGYRRQKKYLPYVVPSVFHPPYRRRENFAFSDQLILDFDHLSSKNLSADKVKDMLSKDERVELMFTSPGGDGVKVFFRLGEKITDHAKYSAFYKIFAAEFAKGYELIQVFDSRTSDVTRACFLSADLFAYYNPDATPVEIGQIVDFEDITGVKHLEEEIDKQQKALVKATSPKVPDQSLDKDVFIEIKKKLNPDYVPRTVKKKIYFVPEELNSAEESIREAMKEYGITVVSVRNINYGKQFLFEYKSEKAEINLFYGKKGFSIVRTVRNFNNRQLQDLIFQIIDRVLTGQD